jgi:hypothetical protein
MADAIESSLPHARSSQNLCGHQAGEAMHGLIAEFYSGCHARSR